MTEVWVRIVLAVVLTVALTALLVWLFAEFGGGIS